MGRAFVLGVLMAASLASLMAGPGAKPALALPSPDTYTYRVLSNPTSSDAFGFRAAIHQNAQGLSDRLFGSLASVLGGEAPKLNFVPSDNPLLANDATASANIADNAGGPKGTVNVSPLAVEALTNNRSEFHDAGVNLFPHEYAHLRQTPQTLADVMRREGGAQAFTDLVTPVAAQRAHIPYVDDPFDGDYHQYVLDVQQQLGRDWILSGQFNRPPVAWP
jgi:ABC-type amino acid transport substrate-binding protein